MKKRMWENVLNQNKFYWRNLNILDVLCRVWSTMVGFIKILYKKRERKHKETKT